jgi:hypothetical protein
MNYRSLAARLALLVAALLLRPDFASAATFTYSSYSVANPQNITILTPNNVVGAAGQITLVGSGANAGETLQAWCLDVFTYLTGSSTYQISSLTTAGAGSPNPSLTTTQIAQIGALMVNGNALINTATDVSAAIQLAIWQTEYGGSFTYSGVSSAVTNLANAYLANVGTGGIWSGGSYGITLLSAPGNQTLGYASGDQNGELTPTPLPAAWLMMVSGLAGIGYVARRRKQQNGASAAA